jgi:PAS domain S-box-containing protein
MGIFGFLLSTLLYYSGISKAHAVINKTNQAVTLFIDGYFSEIINTLMVLEENRDISNAMAFDEKIHREILAGYRSILKSNKNITYVYSGYENGLLLINGYKPPEGYHPSIRPWYQAAIAIKPETSIGLPYQDAISKEWLVATSRALKQSDGRYSGVVAIDCSLENIVKLIAKHDEYQSEFTFVMDRSGKIIIHPNQDAIGNPSHETNGIILQTPECDFTYTNGKREYFAHCRTITSTGWKVVTAVEKKEIVRPIILQLIFLIALTGLIAVLLGIIQSILLSKRLSRPLVELNKMIRATIDGTDVESGEYTYPINEIGDMAREIGQLAERALRAKAFELQESEEMYKTILLASPDDIIICDMSGQVIMTSGTTNRVFEYDPEEASRLSVMDFIAPEDHCRAQANIQKLIHENYSGPNAYRAVRKDGTFVDIEIKSALVYDPLGNPVKMVLNARDITDRKRAEEERLLLEQQFLHAQKLESLGIMAGGIAHDFNNLLQSLLGNMELATRSLAPDTTPHRHIIRATESGKAAAQLTSLMLAYVGKGVLTKRELDLNSLVSVNINMLKATISSAVSLEHFLAQDSLNILVDEAQIQQVIMNLLTNAAESIEEKQGIIKLTTGAQDYDQADLEASLLDRKPEPGRYVFLEISDNGCGMSEETLKRLFDPFFTTKFTGRGLGMSAVMGIMKSHNGALIVKSELGRGTTFRALFPASDDQQLSKIILSDKRSTVTDKTLSGVALVVDDDRNVLRTSKKMMELCGFTVITACDGIEAVSQFKEHSEEINIVLMDLTMPNMDGIAAMNEIYRIRHNVKLILSSGFNKDELSDRITGQAPSGFIRKPYSLAVLETELHRVMVA